jgi:hypothetical protein
MVLVPAATPVTTPVVATPIVATPVLALLQVPPAVVLVRVVVADAHTVAVPDIAPSTGAFNTAIGNIAYAVPHALVIL